ncbi:MAG TPA: acetamidase/formamidase family protein [Gryllotalpicola sp.]
MSGKVATEILQPGHGHIGGEHYLRSEPGTVRWGWLPSLADPPVLNVGSGATVTIDTISHEGVLEDQGRDPVRYLEQFGVPASSVLADARELARDWPERRSDSGPHIVTGPIGVHGAVPGGLLRVDLLELTPRVPYGFISNRDGRGALPGEFPEPGVVPTPRERDAIAAPGTVTHFAALDATGRRARISAGGGRGLGFPVAPFAGILGTVPAAPEPLNSIPPGEHGGNIDLKHLVTGTTVYLPIAHAGALFYVGDPHFAQGNGEVALTALEASLRVTVRLTALPPGRTGAGLPLTVPFAETAEHWIPLGMDISLDRAMQKAVRTAIDFLADRFELPRDVALAYLSAAADFEVTQVVDRVKGVHCMIRKDDFG